MTAPNASVLGVPDCPLGDPTAIKAIASSLRKPLTSGGDLNHAATTVNAVGAQMADWQGVGAAAFSRLLPHVEAALKAMDTRVSAVADATDKYAAALDDVQGHPGDGRRDTWWGLGDAVTTVANDVSTLVTRIQAAINQPVLTPAGQGPPPWPTNFHIDTDHLSIVNGKTWEQLGKWECDPWMDWEHLSVPISNSMSEISKLQSDLKAYQTRVDAFTHSTGPAFFTGLSDTAISAINAIPDVGGYAFVPRVGDPSIPLSEFSSVVVVVEAGDNLTKIADKAYGNTDWQAIYKANKVVVGADPNLILPGQKLTINLPTAAGPGIPLSETGIVSYADTPVYVPPMGPYTPAEAAAIKAGQTGDSTTYDPTLKAPGS